MEPTRQLPDEAVVAYLRTHAPGMPAVRFDGRAIASRARAALRRRRRLRNSAIAAACATTVYLALGIAGPLPMPGVGTVSMPGSNALRALVSGVLPGNHVPGPGQWPADVDRLDREIRPIVEELRIRYYLLEPGRCGLIEYRRGNYTGPGCGEQTPFDDQARVDFDRVTGAVQRSGVSIERIRGDLDVIYVQLNDNSWQYNWEYVYLPDTSTPPAINWPGEEQWTHVRGYWWFHRTHDD